MVYGFVYVLVGVMAATSHWLYAVQPAQYRFAASIYAQTMHEASDAGCGASNGR